MDEDNQATATEDTAEAVPQTEAQELDAIAGEIFSDSDGGDQVTKAEPPGRSESPETQPQPQRSPDDQPETNPDNAPPDPAEQASKSDLWDLATRLDRENRLLRQQAQRPDGSHTVEQLRAARPEQVAEALGWGDDAKLALLSTLSNDDGSTAAGQPQGDLQQLIQQAVAPIRQRMDELVGERQQQAYEADRSALAQQVEDRAFEGGYRHVALSDGGIDRAVAFAAKLAKDYNIIPDWDQHVFPYVEQQLKHEAAQAEAARVAKRERFDKLHSSTHPASATSPPRAATQTQATLGTSGGAPPVPRELNEDEELAKIVDDAWSEIK